MTDLKESLMQFVEAAEESLAKGRTIPCLVLLYCGIDVVASLEEGSTRSSFIKWADRYLKTSSLGCTGSDLYGARCGILHEMTPRSELSQKGKAREIYYAWGSASPDDLAQILKILQRDICVLHVPKLIAAFRHSITDYLEEIRQDPMREQKVKERTRLLFADMQPEPATDFLKQYGRP